MALPLPDISEPRLCFGHQFQVALRASDEVALLSEQRSVVLSGPEYAALQPLLDGSLTADELVEALASAFAPERIYYALARLQQQGLVDAIDGRQRPIGSGFESGCTLEQQACTSPVKCPSPPHIHLYTSIVRQPFANRLESGVLLAPTLASGWGKTDAEARLRCVAEAAERHAGYAPRKDTVSHGRAIDLDGPVIGPREL